MHQESVILSGGFWCLALGVWRKQKFGVYFWDVFDIGDMWKGRDEIRKP